MEKDVMITISGNHYNTSDSGPVGVSGAASGGVSDGVSDGGESIETIHRGTYYNKSGKHYVLFEEYEEVVKDPIRNMIKINGDKVFEIKKSGRRNSHLVFENGKIHMSNYETGFGDFMVGVHTRNLFVTEKEKEILAEIFYSLEMNGEPLSECEIKVKITEVAG